VVSREDFLAERRIAVLSTEDPDGLPYLNAIWFAYEDGAFLVPTAGTSRKARNARERPRGAIVVDARGPAFRGVAAAGRIEVVEGDEALALNARIHRRYVTEQGMAEDDVGGLLTDGDDVTLRLVPERWQEWDLEPFFGMRLGDPRLAEPLAP
jgi:PPOX class probable F420-dependent enzyme